MKSQTRLFAKDSAIIVAGQVQLLSRDLFLHIDELRYVAGRRGMDYNHYQPHDNSDLWLRRHWQPSVLRKANTIYTLLGSEDRANGESTMNPLNWLISQCGRPRGWAGRLLARGMNRAHGPMIDWALSQLSVQDSMALLDIGCGGGGALLRLSERACQAELHGVDYSSQSLRVAARTNRRLIEQGRVCLREANVSDLPYDDDRFDLVVAINCHYFWPDLKGGLRETMRVLQPGGTVALAGGEYFGGKHDARNRKLASNGRMNCQTLPELRDTLCEVGYSNTKIHEEWNKGWFCVTGCKPVVDAE